MTVNNLTVRSWFLALLYALSMPVLASYQLEFSGFASIVANKTFQKDSGNQGNRYDRMSASANMRDLSLLGLRLNLDFDNKLSFTTQAVMYGEDDFKPSFDWIYASYDINNSWQVSLGRTRTPIFMYSAYQDVSYAYTWLSPPHSVYGVPRFKSVDGIQIRHRAMLGEWASDVQFWYGSIKENLKTNDLDGELLLRNNVGVAWDLERNWLRLHSAYMTAETSLDLLTQSQIRPILLAVQAVDSKLAKRLEWKSVEAHFASLGLAAEFERFFVCTEATYIYMGSNLATARSFQSYYLTLGTRVHSNWTLSATFTRDRDRGHDNLGQAYAKVAAHHVLPLSADEFEQQRKQLQQYDTQGFILSARWDFHRSASAKVEYLAEERVFGKDGNTYRPQAIRLGVDIMF